MKRFASLLPALLCSIFIHAQKSGSFSGLDVNMGNLYRLSDAKTRSISSENITGEPGQGGRTEIKNGVAGRNARELGVGWKVNPYTIVDGGKIVTLAEITGQGAIQHIWMTPTGNWRYSILRFYWDDEKEPSVEVPVGDFFGMGWGEYAPLNSAAITVNPGSAFNSYWQMPFRQKCRITLENISTEKMTIFYQVDYTLTTVPADAAYFHAQFRRSNPTKGASHTLVDSIHGKGQYVGTYIGWGVNNNGWWGEGEIKFFIDNDKEFPTINGTGTEDYFCGSYDFENQKTHQYEPFSTAYTGLHQVIKPDGLYTTQQRFGMYRWHVVDPVRFENGLKVTIQDLGWRSEGRYLPQQSDINSVVYWYQTEPHAPFPKLPAKNDLEVN